MRIKATLDQWLVLKAVLEHGGFAQAAEYLHRSQSSVSYAIAQLQSQLGVKILEIKGRKAVLTSTGAILYHRAQNILDSAHTLENIAKGIQGGWPTELTIVVDDPFPREVLTHALSAFTKVTQTRVQIYEESLSGALELLEQGLADIVVAFTVPKGFTEFCQAEIIQVAVAHPDHPLHHLSYPLTHDDLKGYLQLVIRDSGKFASVDKGWLESPNRWTVSSTQLAIHLLKKGLGFAWIPLNYLTDQSLKSLPLTPSRTRRFFLNVLFGKKTPPNQAAIAFADYLNEALIIYHQTIEKQLELRL
ncbi:MAG: LysR family transcriptional regulator [Legionella sp.]|nr:LysR family transcriptional regulator [Legionella sp.]